MEKLCVFCKHWSFSGGSRGYSEMTPGYNATMDCLKQHFTEDEERLFVSQEEYVTTIRKAETCADYKQVKP